MAMVDDVDVIKLAIGFLNQGPISPTAVQKTFILIGRTTVD